MILMGTWHLSTPNQNTDGSTLVGVRKESNPGLVENYLGRHDGLILTHKRKEIEGNFSLTNLIAFYDGMTGWVDEGRAMDVVYLDFSKAFDTVSHNILLGNIRKCVLDEWSVRWI